MCCEAMSEENVEVVRQMWDAFLAGEFETAMSCLANDIEWDGTNLPDGRVGRGHQAVLDHVARWAAAWEDWTVDIEQIRAVDGEKVLVLNRERGRSSSGLKMDERHAELYTVRNGKVVHRVGFSDPSEALQAASLSKSEENVEAVKRAYAAIERGDMTAVFELCDPEIEFDNSNAAFDAAVLHGHEGLLAYFSRSADMWESQRFEAEEISPVGDDQVLIAHRIVSVGRDGVETVAHNANVVTMRNGRAVHIKTFQTKADAVEATGPAD